MPCSVFSLCVTPDCPLYREISVRVCFSVYLVLDSFGEDFSKAQISGRKEFSTPTDEKNGKLIRGVNTQRGTPLCCQAVIPLLAKWDWIWASAREEMDQRGLQVGELQCLLFICYSPPLPRPTLNCRIVPPHCC